MKRERLFQLLQAILDIAIVYFSYFLWFRLGIVLGFPYEARNFLSLKAFVPYIVIVYLVLFLFYRLYDVSKVDFYENFLGIAFSTFFVFLLGFAIPFFIRAFSVPRTVIVYSFLIQILLLTLFHLLVRKIFFSLRGNINILLISRSPDTLKHYLETAMGKRVNIDCTTLHLEGLIGFLKNKSGKFDLFVLDDSIDLEEKEEIIKFFAYLGKPLYLVPRFYELVLLNPDVHILGDLTLFEINLTTISQLEKIIIRILDIFISLVALVMFSPVFLFVSLAILRKDGRPIFYLQKRVGENGKIFETIKFRTMIKDAEKFTGAVLSSENDSRITDVGRFLRKTGLDEIPQFINVLKGEMSVVGPRPERPEIFEKIKEETKEFDLRLKIKPGITGFAQLYGKYNTSFDLKLKMDLLYAKQRNAILTYIYVVINTIKLFLSPYKRE